MTDAMKLRFKEGSSDKIYQAEVVEAPGGYVVNFAFGRYGSTLQTGTKTAKPVNYDKAKQVFDKLISEKLGRGYQPVGTSSVTFVGPVNGKEQSGIKPQLLNPIEEDDLEAYFKDSRWLMQEKKDGERRLIRLADCRGINRNGEFVALPKGIADAVAQFPGAPGAQVLDGEQTGEVYWAFDLWQGSTNTTGCYARMAALFNVYRSVFGEEGHPNFRTVTTWGTEAGKRSAFAKIKAERGEGVVFKDRDSLYKVGRPASRGSQVKFKFVATATCVILGLNGSKRSAQLGVLQNGMPAGVGNVTIPVNFDMPQVGTVAEIRYLYFYKGGALYQPVYLGPRTDLVAADDYTSLKAKQGTEEDEA